MKGPVATDRITTSTEVVMNRIFANRALGLGVVSLLALAGCGGSSSERYSPPTLSHGVVFTYPINGQSDVPLGTRFR